MKHASFAYARRAGSTFRSVSASPSGLNPAIRAALLAVSIVVFLLLLVVIIPLALLFLVFFIIFSVADAIAGLFRPRPGDPDEGPRENVRVIPPSAQRDHS